MAEIQNIDGELYDVYQIKRKIDINQSKQQVDSLVQQIQNIPQQKTEPDQETLDFWNEMNANPDEYEALKDRLEYFVRHANRIPDEYLTQEQLEYRKWLNDFYNSL
jgi:hypothetical protein